LPRALLQFVYPAAAVVFDRLVCGRALSVAQLAGVALMAEALIGPERLRAWRAKVAAFPPELGDAMMRHYLAEPTQWKWFGLLLHRDAQVWSRELLIEAGFRHVDIYWEGIDRRSGYGNSVFRKCVRATNSPGWIAFFVASDGPKRA